MPTNETKNTSTVTNETETVPPAHAKFASATFGQSKFGKRQAGTGTTFTNEAKNA